MHAPNSSIHLNGKDFFQIKKPNRLQAGDTVAAITLSWGGASVFPNRYQAGKQQLEQAFGVKVIETPNALRPAAELAASPQLRAEDLMWAFKNPDVKAIVSIIGGDDSVRLTPYIDLDVIAANPKIFMGYSDTTATHFACLKAGLSSIYGPTFMAGFGENGGLFDYMQQSVARTLFSGDVIGEIKPNTGGWTDDESLSWAKPEDQLKKRPLKPATGIQVLQGDKTAHGHLIGGCIEVLEMLKGTPVWPGLDQWQNSILFIETSEEAPSVDFVVRCMRNYAATGILERLSGIILGRPAKVEPENAIGRYDEAIFHVVNKECGLSHLPIMTQMDFGHTDPMFLIPYGAQATLDPVAKTFSINEAATS